MEWTFSGTIQVPFRYHSVPILAAKTGGWAQNWLRWSQQEARVDDCSRWKTCHLLSPSANVSTFCECLFMFILKWFPYVPSYPVTTSHLVLVWRSPNDTTDGWFDQPSVSTPTPRSELSDGHLPHLPRSPHHVCQTGPGALVLGWDRRVYQVWTLLSWIFFWTFQTCSKKNIPTLPHHPQIPLSHFPQQISSPFSKQLPQALSHPSSANSLRILPSTFSTILIPKFQHFSHDFPLLFQSWVIRIIPKCQVPTIFPNSFLSAQFLRHHLHA